MASSSLQRWAPRCGHDKWSRMKVVINVPSFNKKRVLVLVFCHFFQLRSLLNKVVRAVLLSLDWKTSQGCFQDGSSSELPESGGPTCRFNHQDFMPCVARTFHGTCRRITSLGLVLMVGNFRNPLCDLSCWKIYDHFKNRVSVNLCALSLVSRFYCSRVYCEVVDVFCYIFQKCF